MEPTIVISIASAAGLILGLIGGTLTYRRKISKNRQLNEEKARLIIRDAEIQGENIKKDRIHEAKEKFLKMKQEFEEEANRRKNQIIGNEQKIKQREGQLSKELETIKRKESDLEEDKKDLAVQMEHIKKRREELDRFNDQKVQILENISKLTADQARDQLLETLKEEAQTRASSYVKDIMEQAKIS
ncbi:MAG: Rnase Y domain-containing protein, partial [Bacteroidota bacterium]